ncbi:MAG TPA: hypothetical protein VI238_15300, partial [Dokdonella sp.]
MGAPGKAFPKERLAQLARRAAPALRTLGPFALGTLLLVFGAFLAWQTWLLWLTQRGIDNADAARAEAIGAVAGEVRDRQRMVQQALEDPGVQQSLRLGADGRPAAAAALRALLPTATDAEFFSADLDEVLSGDLKAIGYAKAAALMQAKINPKQPLAEMRTEKTTGQQLMIAMPARVGEQVVAFAVVELPFKPLLDAFSHTTIQGARLELRQGDGQGDLVIASVGERSGSSIGDVGEPIPGTRLRIGKAEPAYFIMFTDSLLASLVLSLLCLGGGALALWIRGVGRERAVAVLQRKPKDVQPEMTLAQALKAGPEPEAPVASRTAAATAPSTRSEKKEE